MVRHISIFTFQDVPDKPLHIQQIRGVLETLPAVCSTVKTQTVAVSALPVPTPPEDAPELFGDLVQVCEFDSPEDAAAYPHTEGHQRLVRLAAPVLRKVTVIDYLC